jgi:4-amino-4-deoxy-L-arabinose transferase-like glycosyltransferase
LTPVTADPLEAPSRRFGVWLVAIVVVGAAIRLGYVWFDRRDVGLEFNDGIYYHHGANVLADGHGFVNPLEQMANGRAEPNADHPPLYLVYLAWFSFLGLRTVTEHLVVSTLLGIAAVAVAGLAGRRIAGERVGLLAAALVAIYPNTWRYDGALLSEGGIILMVLVVVWLAYRFWDDPSPGRLAAVGAVIGLATLARAELFLLVPLLVVPLGLMVATRSWRTRIGWVVLASLVSAAVLLPWVAYNRSRFEEPVYISQNLGGTIAGSYCPTVFDGPLLGYWDFNCPIAAFQASGLPEGSPESDAAVREAGLTYLKDNADRLPVVVAARLGRITGLYRPTQQRDLDARTEGVSSWVATAGMVTLPFMLVGAVAGAIVLRRRRRLVLPLVAPIGCVLATVVIFYAATRFRATAEGPICVLVAVALDALWNRSPWGATTPSD